jgi:hypothetical protein
MRQLSGIYTRVFNERHNRTGHLLQGRDKAIRFQKESHLLEVCRYVVLNPIRAYAIESPGTGNGAAATLWQGRRNPTLALLPTGCSGSLAEKG